jgi:hypothetical protein
MPVDGEMSEPTEDDLKTLGLTAAESGMDMDMHVLHGAKPFDRMFIDTMIPHHRSRPGEGDPEAQPLARTLVRRTVPGGRRADVLTPALGQPVSNSPTGSSARDRPTWGEPCERRSSASRTRRRGKVPTRVRTGAHPVGRRSPRAPQPVSTGHAALRAALPA